MDAASQLQQDAPPAGARVPRKRRQHKRRPLVLVPKQAPLVRANLDKRTLASRQFESMVAQLRRDCGDTGNSGGVSGDRVSGDSLSVVQLAMVEAFAGLTVQLDALNTDVLLGKPVDQSAYCQLITTLVRVGSRLGVRRKPRDVTPADVGQLSRQSGAT
jgi:hypothetical protein